MVVDRCLRACTVAQLRRFPGWVPTSTSVDADDAAVLYVRDDDLVVVDDPVVPDPRRVFEDASPQWMQFCQDELGVRPPGSDSW